MDHMETRTFEETLEKPLNECHFTHRQFPAHGGIMVVRHILGLAVSFSHGT